MHLLYNLFIYFMTNSNAKYSTQVGASASPWCADLLCFPCGRLWLPSLWAAVRRARYLRRRCKPHKITLLKPL